MAVSSDVALAVGARWRLSRVEIPREIPVQATRVQELAAVRALSERFLGIDSQAELRKVDAAYGRNVFTAISKMLSLILVHAAILYFFLGSSIFAAATALRRTHRHG